MNIIIIAFLLFSQTGGRLNEGFHSKIEAVHFVRWLDVNRVVICDYEQKFEGDGGERLVAFDINSEKCPEPGEEAKLSITFSTFPPKSPFIMSKTQK